MPKKQVDKYASKKKISNSELERAGKEIENLFTLYRTTEDEKLIQDIQKIVERVDRPFCFNYRVKGENQDRRQLFVPKRLQSLSKRELMLRLDLK